MQKTIQKEFKIEKVIKKKGDRLYVKWKGYDNSFNSAENMKVALDLFNYAMKVDLKGATGIDTSTLPSKTVLATIIFIIF